MLEPLDRRLLLDALHPPPGYVLEAAVGTTFSLDLLALLTVPLAFTLFDWEDKEGKPVADPLALLEAVRRHADRMALFCQAGQIAIPRQDQRLYAYVESSVVQVEPRIANRAFHPKVWVLRFDTTGAPALYRLLCASRNLTFDRCWDTLLVLDGEVRRRGTIERNRPLAGFVQALPSLAVRRPIPEPAQSVVDLIYSDLLRADFEIPAPFEKLRFWPLGHRRGAPTWPFDERIERLLTVSPFVASGCLDRLARSGRGDVLVSRADELARLPPSTLAPFKFVRVLLEAANVEASDQPAEVSEDTSLASATCQPSTTASVPLVGLHAKLYVADDGWNAHVWTGSANATNAAFGGNVRVPGPTHGQEERVWGRKSAYPAEGRGFSSVLQDFPSEYEQIAVNPLEERLDALLELGRRALTSTALEARAEPDGTGFRFGCTRRGRRRCLPASWAAVGRLRYTRATRPHWIVRAV